MIITTHIVNAQNQVEVVEAIWADNKKPIVNNKVIVKNIISGRTMPGTILSIAEKPKSLGNLRYTAKYPVLEHERTKYREMRDCEN